MRTREYKQDNIWIKVEETEETIYILALDGCIPYHARIISGSEVTSFYNDEKHIVELIEKEFGIKVPTKGRYRTYKELEAICFFNTEDIPVGIITKDNNYFPFEENCIQYNVRISRDSKVRIPKEYKCIGELREYSLILSEGKTKIDVNLEKGKLYVYSNNILIVEE